MAEVEFIYKGAKITAFCNRNEKMKNIIQRFTKIINLNDNSNISYLYDG